MTNNLNEMFSTEVLGMQIVKIKLAHILQLRMNDHSQNLYRVVTQKHHGFIVGIPTSEKLTEPLMGSNSPGVSRKRQRSQALKTWGGAVKLKPRKYGLQLSLFKFENLSQGTHPRPFS